MRNKLMGIIHDNEDIYQNVNSYNVVEDLQGWGSEDAIFADILKDINPKLIVEVGTWKGASAIHMAQICKKLNYDTQILCVDTWLGSEEYYTNLRGWHSHLNKRSGFPSVYYTFLKNVISNKLESNIIPFPTTSVIAAYVLKFYDIHPDVVYLDGSHDYHSTKLDLNLYFDLLSHGGFLIGDDHSSYWHGVIDAVQEFKQERNIDVTIIGCKYVIKKI